MFEIIVTIGGTGFENSGNFIKLKNCTDKNKNSFRDGIIHPGKSEILQSPLQSFYIVLRNV